MPNRVISNVKICGRTASYGAITLAALFLFSSAHAQNSNKEPNPDDSLRNYAVKFVKTRFFKRVTGNAIYLGHGAVITAAHVVGRWHYLTNPHVIIGGEELPAKVVKHGSLETTDLTVLAVDETRLPVSVRLRLNPVCKVPPRVNDEIVVVTAEATVRSKILSPFSILPKYRANFGTIIADVPLASSGSGIFHARRRCLLGITSRKIHIYNLRKEKQRMLAKPAGFAKYFVPAPTIAKFIPAEYRF